VSGQDHHESARIWLEDAFVGEHSIAETAEQAIAAAQVYATLAVADAIAAVAPTPPTSAPRSSTCCGPQMPEAARELFVYAYEDWPDLYVYRCRACGSTGPRDSECGGHYPPPEMNQDTLSVPRVVVKVPQDDEVPVSAERLEELEQTERECVELRGRVA
jgi:hypothetical protein